MLHQRITIVLLLVAVLAAACASPLEPAPPPTLEPVQPRQPAAGPSAARPTATPVPLGQATAAVAPTAGADILPTPPPLVADTPQPAEGAPSASIPTASCLASTGGATRLPGQRYGVNIYADGNNVDRVLDLAGDLHASWVRAQVRWSDMEPQPGAYQWQQVDALAAGAEARGLKVLLTVSQSPAWATASGNGGLPDNPGDFGAFMSALASHARGKIAAYEIWHNPNTAAANGGTVADAGKYVEVLKAAYQAIKTVDPCILVLNGALLPTAERDPAVALDDLAFYRSMLRYNGGEFRDLHDILAIQLNTSGRSGRGKWPREAPAQSRGFYGHAEFVRDEMIAGDEEERHAWVVEVGYRVAGEHAVAPDQQGEYLADLFSLSRKSYPWISGIFVRDLALGQQAGDQAAFSLVNPDGSERPGFRVIRGYFTKQREQNDRQTPIKNTDVYLLWWFTPYHQPTSPLALAPDGSIHSTTEIGFVRTVDPNGAFRAFTRIAKKNIVGIAVDKRLNVYATSSAGTMTALTGGGSPLWEVLTPDQATDKGLIASPDGQQLYTGTSREHLDAYATADGKRLWSLPLGGIPGSPAAGSDGTVYVGSTDGTFHAVAPNGTPRWTYKAGSWVVAPPVFHGPNIYAVSDGGAAFALDAGGTQLWRSDLGAKGVGIAVGPDGTLYASTADSRLHALGPDGRPRWVVSINGGRPTAPAVAVDGRIYLGAADGRLRLITPDGQVAGEFDFQRPLRTAPVAGLDGAVYVALPKDDAALVAFGPKELLERYRIP